MGRRRLGNARRGGGRSMEGGEDGLAVELGREKIAAGRRVITLAARRSDMMDVI